MTPLGEIIAAEIKHNGPMPLSRYMDLCLYHEIYGYYTVSNSIGETGDFVTAPEISQMFGEMVGIWIVSLWEILGQPKHLKIIELGPGNGTLMADILRVTARFKACDHALEPWLVETSPRLTKIQQSQLGKAKTNWTKQLADVPEGLEIIIGNEFFDALSIDQYIKTKAGWNKRLVDFNDNEFCMIESISSPYPSRLNRYTGQPIGSVVEISDTLDIISQQIGRRLNQNGGFGLFFDYGEWDGIGDTFQAVENHLFSNALKDHGTVDLTSQVNFRRVVNMSNCFYKFTKQGEFLNNMGIEHRAHELAAKATDENQKLLLDSLHRLTHDSQMGKLFKTLALSTRSISNLPGFN